MQSEDRYAFDFGTGEPALGYVKIMSDTLYEPERGYGFLSASGLTGIRREGETGLGADFVIPLEAAFRVDVPKDGLYTLRLTIGDPWFATETTVKGTDGQMLLYQLRTPPGYMERFSVTLPAVEGRIVLYFSGRAPRLNGLELAPALDACTLFIAGDSTVANQPADGYPYAGWGQMLPAWMKQDAAVINAAASGRSSKSFVDEGRLDRIWTCMRPGDYLLIQFGHNDQKSDPSRYTEPFSTYKEHLRMYIDGCRERKAVPILVTSVHRRFFDDNGRLKDTHGDYVTAVRELAQEEQVPLVDLAAISMGLFNELGPEGTRSIFMWGAPGEWMNFPLGVSDNTHFQERGALRLAELVAEGLKSLALQPLSLFLRMQQG
ncbi:rhamnogalacturonan acetylesterase [Paenibacillus lactis]|uniref:rhamnogalacturonan acetylesterase n=1 Tax=Paenibacillus lactis TaxID=228574 RepID=UPI001B22CAB8|nr:rhamnogalacturonan acetylesterase [Paenibacillus lactis]GIO90880.1 hypothetical protein J31TS3_21070 [Paenibacillus lactis]